MILVVLAVLGCFALIVFAVDAWFVIRIWSGRIHIGQWADRLDWQKALEIKARKWLKHSPVVRISDQSRFVLWDILRGNFRSHTIQSWQDAGLLLALDDEDAKNYVESHPSAFKKGQLRPDNALLAYALARHNALKEADKRQIDDLFAPYISNSETIPYRKDLPDLRFVDTLGMVCPYLCAIGQCSLAEKQIAEYDDALLNGIFPSHVWDLKSKLPLGVHDWSRGIGWYILALVESTGLSGREARMQKLAEALLPLQRKDGGFSAMMFDSGSRYESSGTALAGLLFLKVYEESKDQKYLKAAFAVEKSLMSATRRDGAVDYAQGDTKGVGFYSTQFDAMPFAQGMALYLSKNLNKYA